MHAPLYTDPHSSLIPQHVFYPILDETTRSLCRTTYLASIRQEIANGTYMSDDREDAAIDRLLDELADDHCIGCEDTLEREIRNARNRGESAYRRHLKTGDNRETANDEGFEPQRTAFFQGWDDAAAEAGDPWDVAAN